MRPDGDRAGTGSFGQYCIRVAKRLITHAAPWARDNIAFGVLVLVIPPLLVYSRDHSHPIDWMMLGATLRLYALCLGVYVVFHLVRAVWKLDAENKAELLALNSQLEKLQSVPNDLGARAHALSTDILDFIYARLKDAPKHRGKFFASSNSFDEFSEIIARNTEVRNFEKDTLGIYSYKFSRNVSSIVQEFANVGIVAADMDGVWTQPANSEAIQRIGHVLAQMADAWSKQNAVDYVAPKGE